MTTSLVTTTHTDGTQSTEVVKGRNLTQDELDGFWRYEFVKEVLEFTKTSTARFVVRGKTHGNYHLVTVEYQRNGEWSFSASGLGSWYTYKYSDLVSFLEGIWDKAASMTSLEGEIKVTFNHPTANSD